MKRVIAILGALFVVTLSLPAADIDDLLKKLKNKDPDVRRTAAKDLSEAGPDAKAALPGLLKGLKDKDLYVRRFSAEAIGNIGTENRAVLYGLQGVINDAKEQKEVQEAAVVALGKLGKGGVDPLILAVRDSKKESEVRRKAIIALGKIGTDAHPAVPALVDVLQGKDNGAAKGKAPANTNDDLRIELCTSLGNIANASDESAVKALEAIAAARSRNAALKGAAGSAVKKIKARK